MMDPFAGATDATLAELREVLRPVVENGIVCEVDPTIPGTLGFALVGGIYRVSVATNRDTGAEQVVIFDLNMQPMSKGELHTLIRAVVDPPVSIAAPSLPPTSALSPGYVAPKSMAQRQVELLEAIHATLIEIRNRLP